MYGDLKILCPFRLLTFVKKRINTPFLGCHSLMARPQDSVSLFWKKGHYPQFLESKCPFFICMIFIHIICKKDLPGITRGHQERFPWVSLGSLGFPQINIIDFTNRRPKMAVFSLKTFRLF